VLVLMWTGTFLHDIDEFALQLGMIDVHVEDGDHHHHGGHSHGISLDDTPVMAMPEMHGHDPSVLSSVRNGQVVSNLVLATVCTLPWSPVYVSDTKSVLCNACRERPPPQKIPTYLLYRAMLI
jgi:hypothetical protein